MTNFVDIEKHTSILALYLIISCYHCNLFQAVTCSTHIGERIWRARQSMADRSPLRHDPKRATDIVLATVALHNFLRSKRTTRQLYTPSDSLDVEDILTGEHVVYHPCIM